MWNTCKNEDQTVQRVFITNLVSIEKIHDCIDQC